MNKPAFSARDNGAEANVGPSPAGGGSGHLVADIADRNPFESSWSDLDISDVERFLTSTIEDEPLHWEAKAIEVTPDHVRRAVTAFANREGGYLIMGAQRDPASRTWRLPGVRFPGTEPRTWLSNVIRSSVSPPPEFDIHAWARSDDLKIAVVMIQPNYGFLSMSGGRVYYRRPGESSYIENGAELQAIHNTVQYRSRALPGGGRPPQAPHEQPIPAQPPEPLEPGMDAAAAIAALRRGLDSGKEAEITVYLTAAMNAVAEAFGRSDETALVNGLDRLVDATAVIVSFAPQSAPATRAVSAIHEVFDRGQQRQGGVNALPREQLWLQLLAQARALGALGVRRRHWSSLRSLILHEVSGEARRLWRYWFRYGDVSISRAQLYTAGANVLEGSRVPLRLAAEHALRLPSLRPDGVTDEDSLVTSICQFDLVTNLVSIWESREDKPSQAAYPYFAAWGGERVRPIAERVIDDPACREALLPCISDHDLADLLRFVASEAEQHSQGLGSWGFWEGFLEGKVASFIQTYGGTAG